MITKRIVILIAAAILLGIFLFWLTHSESQSGSEREAVKPVKSSTQSKPESAASSQHASPSRITPDGIDLDNQDNWGKVPVAFYGKVVDEKNQPVEGATIQVQWPDARGDFAHTNVVSKTDGRFSVTGLGGQAIALTIEVSKEGYYFVRKGQRNYFHYAEDGMGDSTWSRFIPDPKNPFIFQLRKKGEVAELVRVEKDFIIPKDGTPVEIDLVAGRKASAGKGHIKVECWTMDQHVQVNHPQPFDWRCRLSIPEGGLIETTEEFPFEAPLDGYRPFDEINVPASLGQEGKVRWSSSAEKRYFLKLRDGNYARIKFEMIAGGGHFCVIESYLNPDKSRNLEYDKSKEIEVFRK